MNCHKAVSEGTTTGTAEIAKIYAATGWDPATQKYSGTETPIKWVKVHNLPDHVYFSHEQHVAVGKIECQGHKVFGFLCGIAEHHSLVSGPL